MDDDQQRLKIVEDVILLKKIQVGPALDGEDGNATLRDLIPPKEMIRMASEAKAEALKLVAEAKAEALKFKTELTAPGSPLH
jgi:hypothetical protein